MGEFDNMVLLSEDSEHGAIYQKVLAYLTQHFTDLPRVDIYYDAEGKSTSENRQHEMVTGGLVVVEELAIGLLLENEQLDLDAVSATCIPELQMRYGYHE